MRLFQTRMRAAQYVAVPSHQFLVQADRHECVSQQKGHGPVGLCRGDRLLAPSEEPTVGAHLITPRFAYAHHGVYVGGGAVVHYSALASKWSGGPVEEISLEGFAHGRAVWVRPARHGSLPAAEIVRRARSQLSSNADRASMKVFAVNSGAGSALVRAHGRGL